MINQEDMVKIFIKNSRGFILAANHWFAGSESIIIMAAGLTGDKSMNGRFEKLAAKFSQGGISVITFDYCGCGESDDEILTPENAVIDLQSVINYAKNRGYKNIGLYGQSYGSLVCLRVYNSDIKTIVLTGALTGSIKYIWENYYSKEQLDELSKTGHMRIYKDAGSPREMVIVDKIMFDDFEQINQEQLLTKIKCPVLIIHGDHDDEERTLLDISRRGMKYLPHDSKIELIEGADHRFNEHLNIISDLSLKWFLGYL
jgi:pimeloyl-ACP methyl ester carboxylesterase